MLFLGDRSHPEIRTFQNEKSASFFFSFNNFVWCHIMMKAMIANGNPLKSLHYYTKAKQKFNDSLQPITFTLALNACAKLKNIEKGEMIIKDLNNSRVKNKDMTLLTSLLHFYGECGMFEEALNIWNTIGEGTKEKIQYSAMMKVCNSNAKYAHTLRLYQEMKTKKVGTDHITFILVLNACANLKNFEKGQKMIIKEELSNEEIVKDPTLFSACVCFYGESRKLDKTRHLWNSFISNKHKMNDNDLLIGYNAMMTALNTTEQYLDTISLYHDLPHPNGVTKILVLNACAKSRQFETGISIAKSIPKQEILSDSTLFSAVIHLYGEYKDIDTVRSLWNCLGTRERDIISVNASMTAFINCGAHKEAMSIYDSLGVHDIVKNDVTLLLGLMICVEENAFDKGKRIHDEIVRRGGKKWLSNPKLITALVHLYGNSGDVEAMEDVASLIENDTGSFLCFSLFSCCLIGRRRAIESHWV